VVKDTGADRGVVPLVHRGDPGRRRPGTKRLLGGVGGRYPPGSKLPSETELIEEYDVSRLTVRRALAVLMVEGRTESKRGVGVYVREAQPVLRMGNSRLVQPTARPVRVLWLLKRSAWAWIGIREVLELTIVDAPPAVREVLGEARVVVKRRRMIVAGKPTQLADSYLPESVATAINCTRTRNPLSVRQTD
jgi:GntR family transcriptional regulator